MAEKTKSLKKANMADIIKRKLEEKAAKEVVTPPEEKREDEDKKPILVYQPIYKGIKRMTVIPPDHPVYQRYYPFAKSMAIMKGAPVAEFLRESLVKKYSETLIYLPGVKNDTSRTDSENPSRVQGLKQ